MKIKEFFALVLNILKDWRVIVTLVVMLFVMWAANFILTYKKKPRKSKKDKKAAAEAAPAKPAEEKKEESKEEASE
ncbi:MAG: hypothetical protein J5726_06295 [Treponema sp.]|nr:hypothetical protein [Treponema sp.]